jgi:PKD repeat protein
MKRSIFILLILCLSFIGCERNNDQETPLDPEPINGISSGYVSLDVEGVKIEHYDNTQGTVLLSFTNTKPDLRKGSIVTVDLDTMGYLRRVTEVKVEGNNVSLQTIQAYLNDVFVDKDFKLSTDILDESQIIESKSTSHEKPKDLIDKNGYIHPSEIIYYDEKGEAQLIRLNKIRPTSKVGDFKILDFNEDFSGKDLYGSSEGEVHLYISDGNAGLQANAVFEFEFDSNGEYDKDTQVKKGDLTKFDFYFDNVAEFKAKLALDLTTGFEKSDEVKLKDFRKKTVKFLVSGIPVWISFDCNIYAAYSLNANATVHADWGFECIDNLKVGDNYDALTETHTIIKEYTPQNIVYPLNISGNVTLGANLEIYPRIEVLFYSLFGPYIEIAPYVNGTYSTALLSQFIPTGEEAIYAWNSGIDLGLNFRIGAKLDFIGKKFDQEFGPKEINCFEYPLWNAPDNIKLLSSIPTEISNGIPITLLLEVKDNLKNPKSFCPVYISGDGSFDKIIGSTDNEGKFSINWIPGVSTTGQKSFSAKIYNAEGEVIDEVVGQTSVIDNSPVSAFSVSSTSITAGQSVQFTDMSTNSPTSWSWDFGDGEVSTQQNPSHMYSTAGSYTVSLTATNSFGSNTETEENYITVNEPASEPIPTDGLVAYYPFNGNANDESGNGNNGTVYGATATTDRFGQEKKAYNFVGDNVNRITLSPFAPPSVISLSIWFYPTTSGPSGLNNSVLFSNIYGGRNYDNIYVGMQNGLINFLIRNSAGTGFIIYSNSSISLNQWNHLVCIIDEQKQLRMYLDNVLQTQTNTWSGSYNGQTVTNIGNNVNDDDNFDGSLDDIRIYNYALTSSEINTLYHEGD